MSTRSNVLLYSPEGARVYFYRHTDGFLANAGARLYHTATAMFAKSREDGWPWIGEFAERLLRAQTERGDPLYRMTSGPHEDIEYFYALEFPGFRGEEARHADKDDPNAYSRNCSLLKFRWACGYGPTLQEEALAKAGLSRDEFCKDITKNADRPPEADGD